MTETMHEFYYERPLFLIPFSVGILFTIIAWIGLKIPPKEINALYGYRTAKSMKSQDRWDFAQHFSGRLMIKSGLLLALTSGLSFFVQFNPTIETILSFLFIAIACIYIFAKTEKAIESNFKSTP